MSLPGTTSSSGDSNPYSPSNFKVERWIGSGTDDSVSSSYLESLETSELALVQHIKTAGLRKQVIRITSFHSYCHLTLRLCLC
jgi:hypothetical protein